MSTSSLFTFTRDAAEASRPSSLLTFVRQAAKTSRPSSLFQWVRGAPVPGASLGPGVDGFIKIFPATSLGPGLDGFIEFIPGTSLGPGLDGFVLFIPPPVLTTRLSLVGKTAGRAHATTVEGSVRLATTISIDPFVDVSTPIHVGVAPLTSIQLVVVRCTAADSITAPMTAGVGVSGTELIGPQALIGLTQTGKHWIFPFGPGASSILSGGDTLNLVITGIPTGVSQTIAVDVFGHEL